MLFLGYPLNVISNVQLYLQTLLLRLLLSIVIPLVLVYIGVLLDVLVHLYIHLIEIHLHQKLLLFKRYVTLHDHLLIQLHLVILVIIHRSLSSIEFAYLLVQPILRVHIKYHSIVLLTITKS